MTTQNNSNNNQIVSLKADLDRLKKIHTLYNELDAIEIDSKIQRTVQVMKDISKCKKQIKELERKEELLLSLEESK